MNTSKDDEMEPTCELRVLLDPHSGGGILQQKWQYKNKSLRDPWMDEWREIPRVKKEDP